MPLSLNDIKDRALAFSREWEGEKSESAAPEVKRKTPQEEKVKGTEMTEKESLIPKHGGYRNLKSFQLSQLVYDVTVRFCDLYINKRSRTHDQMVQAARSGVQNIAEGSQASATSRKTELKLTNVARAGLEELRLDFEDYLRPRELPMWEPDHPALKRFTERLYRLRSTKRKSRLG